MKDRVKSFPQYNIVYRKASKYIFAVLTALAVILGPVFITRVGASMPVPVTSQSTYETWLALTGRPVWSRYRGLVANYAVYRDYNILSYGTPSDVPGNRYDAASNQYAVHGFSYDEIQVTNTFFPNDSSGYSNPLSWINLNLGRDAEVSWMRLSSREKEYIKNSQIYFMGLPFGYMTFSSLALTELKCIVIAIPSWYMGFSLFTMHYNSSHQLRYATLHGYGAGSVSLTGTVLPTAPSVNNEYHIPAGKEYVDITFRINSSISGYTGLAKQSDISRGGIVFRWFQNETTGAGPWSTNRTIRYFRKAPDRAVGGTQIITESATLWVVSGLGDLVSKNIQYTFTLIEDGEPPAMTGQLSINGDIEFFRGSKSLIGFNLPKNDRRFLCLENITLRFEASGNILPDYVLFYPPGGNETRVEFSPTSDSTGFAECSYYLGIIDSTISWNNNRLRLPYTCIARAYTGNNYSEYKLEGIEVTGCIYDVVYLQAALPE